MNINVTTCLEIPDVLPFPLDGHMSSRRIEGWVLMPEENAFREAFLELSDRRGFAKQEELADLININVSSLREIEAGRRKPDLHVFYLLWDALGDEFPILMRKSPALARRPGRSRPHRGTTVDKVIDLGEGDK